MSLNQCAQLVVLLGLGEWEVGRQVEYESWHSQESQNMALAFKKLAIPRGIQDSQEESIREQCKTMSINWNWNSPGRLQGRGRAWAGKEKRGWIIREEVERPF